MHTHACAHLRTYGRVEFALAWDETSLKIIGLARHGAGAVVALSKLWHGADASLARRTPTQVLAQPLRWHGICVARTWHWPSPSTPWTARPSRRRIWRRRRRRARRRGCRPSPPSASVAASGASSAPPSVAASPTSLPDHNGQNTQMRMSNSQMRYLSERRMNEQESCVRKHMLNQQVE